MKVEAHPSKPRQPAWYAKLSPAERGLVIAKLVRRLRRKDRVAAVALSIVHGEVDLQLLDMVLCDYLMAVKHEG